MEFDLKVVCRGLTCISALIEAVSYCYEIRRGSGLSYEDSLDIFNRIVCDISLGKTNLPDLDELITTGSFVVPYEAIGLENIVYHRPFRDNEDDLEDPEFKDDNYGEDYMNQEVKFSMKDGFSAIVAPLKQTIFDPPIEWVALTMDKGEFLDLKNIPIQISDVDLKFSVIVTVY